MSGLRERHERAIIRPATAVVVAPERRVGDPTRRLRDLWPHHPVAWAAVIFAAVLVLAPLASLVTIAVQGNGDLWGHMIAHVLPAAVLDTVLLLAGIAATTAVIGTAAAWCVTAYVFPGRNVLVWLLPLPLAFPTYIVAYVYVDMLDALGPVQVALRDVFGYRAANDYWFPQVRSLGGAIVVMSFVLYPYVYLATRAMFLTRSAALVESAMLLGARPWRIAREITLPLARPALAAGLALVLMEALNDIGATEYLGVRTLTLTIFTTWNNRGSLPGAAQIACVMLTFVAALIVLEQWARRRRDVVRGEVHGCSPAPVRLSGWRAGVALLICALPVTAGFVLPVWFLLREVVRRGLVGGFDHALLGHVVTTVAFAGAATAAVAALGFGIVFAQRLIGRPAARVGVGIASLGYAVPGTVLALGLLAPLIALDGALDALARAVGVGGVGLVLIGSGAAVVIAYTVRFMAIATGFAQAGLAPVSIDLDDAARGLGARAGRVVRAIHIPLARPALAGAALLVFVDCLKELPATLLLRPLNVETLATYIYQYATRGSFEEGALAALLIVLVGVVPVIRMVRFADDLDPARRLK